MSHASCRNEFNLHAVDQHYSGRCAKISFRCGMMRKKAALAPFRWTRTWMLREIPREIVAALFPSALYLSTIIRSRSLPILYADESHCLPSRPRSISVSSPSSRFSWWLREKSLSLRAPSTAQWTRTRPKIDLSRKRLQSFQISRCFAMSLQSVANWH